MRPKSARPSRRKQESIELASVESAVYLQRVGPLVLISLKRATAHIVGASASLPRMSLTRWNQSRLFPGTKFMQPELDSYLDRRREQITNRTKFPVEELASYAGQWIAWSADGSRIVAQTTDPECLDLYRAPSARTLCSVRLREFQPMIR